METPAPVLVAPPEVAHESVAKKEEIEEPMEEGDAGTECLEIATETTAQVRIHIHELLLSSANIYVTSACVMS